MYRNFKKICNNDHTSAWKSKTRVVFNGSCLKQYIYSSKNSKYFHCLRNRFVELCIQ